MKELEQFYLKSSMCYEDEKKKPLQIITNKSVI